MAEHKIPAFLSKKFAAASRDQRSKLIEQLNAWKASGITQDLLEWLSEAVRKDEELEDSTVFESEFKTIQEYSWHKGFRTAYRKLEKQLRDD